MIIELYEGIIWVLFVFMIVTALKTKTEKGFDSFEVGGKWGIANYIFSGLFVFMTVGIVFFYNYDPHEVFVDKQHDYIPLLIGQVVLSAVVLVFSRLAKYMF